MVKISFFALMILCVVCLMLFATTTLTNGGQVYKTFAAHPDTPPAGGLLLWAKTDNTFQVTTSGGTDSGMGGGGGGGAGPIVSAYNDADTSNGTAAAFNIVTFNQHNFDSSAGAMHSTSTLTSRFLAPTTGYYAARCSLMMASGGDFFAKLTLNGTDIQGSGIGATAGGSNTNRVASAFVSMTAGQYVECQFNAPITDHPISGITWTGANFQWVKLF